MATRQHPEDDSEDNYDQENAPGDLDGGDGGFGSFFSMGEAEPPGPGSLLAAFESPADADGDDEPEPIQLECINLDWVSSGEGRRYSDAVRWQRQQTLRPRLSVLELKRQPGWLVRDQPGAVSWYAVKYEPCDARDADGRLYSNLFAPGIPVRVEGARAEGTDRAAADRIEALAGRINANFSRVIPVPYRVRDTERTGGVAVYDVGQGAWQAALDKHTLRPFVYIDCGGGVLFNRKTFPPNFRSPPPVENIIISHWDWDHWSSAHRFTRLLGAHWYTPPVPAKPIQIEVALQIASFGHLHVLDIAAGRAVDVGCLTIERCTGTTENDRGFAVTVHSRQSERARRCLLPGDAAYRYIPSVCAPMPQAFHALSMSHHGGRLHSGHYPVPKTRAVAANSAGPGNTYKHPLFKTLSVHKASGWPMPVQTGMSGSRPCHVLLPWGQKPQLFHGSSDLSGPSLQV